MKRIAVCFSGHIRNWNEAKLNQKLHWDMMSLHSSQNEEIVVDYFFHTWNVSEEREYRLQPFIKRTISDIEIQSIIDFYKPKKWIVDTKDADDFQNMDKWLAIFYGFNKSIELKRDYEIENGFEYDLVIKSRLDLVFNPNKPANLYQLYGIPMEIISTFHGNMFNEFCLVNFNDVLFYASSPVMDLVSNIYFFRKNSMEEPKKDLNNRSIGPGPGAIMKQFFEEYTIKTPLPDCIHTEHGLFTHDGEIIVRGLHKNIGDLNDIANWPEIIRLRNVWFNG